MLRCIYCNRGEHQTNLSASFTCTDREACDAVIANRNTKPVLVVIKGDCACHGPNKAGGTERGVGVYTTIASIHSPEHSGTKDIGFGDLWGGEWTALRYCLSVAVLMRKENPKYTFRIFGDSQGVIRTVTGEYKAGAKSKRHLDKVQRLQQKLGVSLLSISWCPRSENKEADALSKEAISHLK